MLAVQISPLALPGMEGLLQVGIVHHPQDGALILFGTAPYDEKLIRKSFEVAYRYVSRAEDLRRSGSAAIDLCMVASGRAFSKENLRKAMPVSRHAWSKPRERHRR